MNARFLTEAREIEAKWSKPLSNGKTMLDGLDNRYERATAAVILENQRLVNEQMTDSSDVAQFKRISIPLVRRIYPQLIANKIVSVQPLLGPAGLVYYMRTRYSSDKGATRGASINGGYPNDDRNSMQQLASGDGNLDIYYSHQFVQNETSTTDAGDDVTSVFAPLEHTPIIAGTIAGSIYAAGVLVQHFVVAENGTFTLTDVGTPTNKVTSGTIDLVTGEVVLTWNNAPGANYIVASYEYNMECNADLPEINLAIESEEIVAKSRKLKAVWSFEVQQDLRAQHSLDVEAEITTILAQEINLEIDREIISDLRNNAGTVAVWDFSTALGHNIKEKYESLYVKITELSAVVHRKTLRGGCNWIVTSPEIASIFETCTAGFAPSSTDGFTGGLGVQHVGSVGTRWKIYKDPLFPQGQILMGYKGNSYMDSGYFYSPYIPLTQTQTIPDPETFCPRKGIVTRYGKKMLREGAKFYARMNVANFVI